MDVSTLNTKDPAENGAFLHLRHPFTGELLWSDEKKTEKVGLMVRGNEAPTVQKALKKVTRGLNTRKRARPGDSDEKRGMIYARALVMEFIGLTKEGRDLDADDESDIEWFFDQSDDFVAQVIEFAEDRANFFKAPKSD